MQKVKGLGATDTQDLYNGKKTDHRNYQITPQAKLYL